MSEFRDIRHLLIQVSKKMAKTKKMVPNRNRKDLKYFFVVEAFKVF